MVAMTPAQKQARRRKKMNLLGYRQVNVWVAADRVEEVREFAASLPEPATPTDPRQLDLLAKIEAQEAAEDGDQSPDQPSLL